jgi:hypothetical protein
LTTGLRQMSTQNNERFFASLGNDEERFNSLTLQRIHG